VKKTSAAIIGMGTNVSDGGKGKLFFADKHLERINAEGGNKLAVILYTIVLSHVKIVVHPKLR